MEHENELELRADDLEDTSLLESEGESPVATILDSVTDAPGEIEVPEANEEIPDTVPEIETLDAKDVSVETVPQATADESVVVEGFPVPTVSLEEDIGEDVYEVTVAEDEEVIEIEEEDEMGEDEEAAACVESVPQEVISPIARARSAKSQDRAVAVREKQLVIFRVSDEFYGVDIAVVQEVIKLQRITAVPRAPDFIEGLINLRGTVLPVIDLRRRFGLPEQPPTKETRIVIAEIKEMSIGVLVDAVTEVLRVPESEIEPPSPLSVTMDSAFIFGIAKIPPRLIALLDLNKVLAVEERK